MDHVYSYSIIILSRYSKGGGGFRRIACSQTYVVVPLHTCTCTYTHIYYKGTMIIVLSKNEFVPHKNPHLIIGELVHKLIFMSTYVHRDKAVCTAYTLAHIMLLLHTVLMNTTSITLR